jgi:hypothetical protein
MHAPQTLFTAEEAFSRLGQLRETGCLVIVSDKVTSRIFTKDAFVINAYSEGMEGQAALDASLADMNASYVWLPGATPGQETMKVDITSHALQNAIARDIHHSKTSKVKLDGVDRSSIPAHKKISRYFLSPLERIEEKITLDKSSVIVGRDDVCDIVIPDPRVSRRHCLLQQTARGLTFKDMESANGTFINNISAKDGFLHPGDKLSLGGYELVIQREPK